VVACLLPLLPLMHPSGCETEWCSSRVAGRPKNKVLQGGHRIKRGCIRTYPFVLVPDFCAFFLSQRGEGKRDDLREFAVAPWLASFWWGPLNAPKMPRSAHFCMEEKPNATRTNTSVPWTRTANAPRQPVHSALQ